MYVMCPLPKLGPSWWWSYGSWIYNYRCNPNPLRRSVLDTILCKICQWLAAGQWFSTGTPVSSTNKTNSHDITQILLKMALNTITLTLPKLHMRTTKLIRGS